MINEDIQKPDELKMIKYNDLVSYYKNINKEITEEQLKKQGFYENEINWLKENKEKEKMDKPQIYSYKETTKTKINTYYVHKKDLNKISNIIRDQTRNKQKTTDYRRIVKRLINDKKLRISIDAFNGGRNRSRYYFKYYYYPIKVLQELGNIKYNKGVITKK